MVGNAQAQMYDNQYRHDNNYYQDDNRYSYDKKDSKSSHTDIQKIKCVNSNINVNGIDITEIPQGSSALATTNEGAGATDASNSENGNGLDKINFDKNLVNICVNVNDNNQIKTIAPEEDQACENCFSILSEEDLEGFLMIFDQTVDSATGEEIDINTLADLCEFLETSTAISSTEKWQLLNTTLNSQGVSQQDRDIILQCLEDLGIIVEPA